jgi:tetratricopeptide (TPR) repeat protein
MSVDAGVIIKAMRAVALYELGRYREADDAAREALDMNVWDTASNYLSLCVCAMVAAQQDEFERAESMAREALEIIDEGDFINDQADARMALAEVLELAGRREEAADAVREALGRYRAKGNLTQTATAEERLADLAG